MPSDERMPRLIPDTDLKIRHLQQHLHRLGQIPAAPHPFVKQAAEQGDRLDRQPQHPPSLAQHLAHWRNRLVQRIGNSIEHSIEHSIEQQWTVPSPQHFDADFEADNQAAITSQLPSDPHRKL